MVKPQFPSASVAPASRLRRACASGRIFDVPVEVRFGTSMTRTAVALHEIHRRAEELVKQAGVTRPSADVIAAVAEAADELVTTWALEVADEVSIGIGVSLASSNEALIDIGDIPHECVVLIRLGQHTIAAGSVPTSGGSIVTCSGASATESLTLARQVAYGHASPTVRAITITNEGELVTHVGSA